MINTLLCGKRGSLKHHSEQCQELSDLPVKTRAVVELSVYNVGYVRYCLRSGIGKEMEGDGADSCIDNKEVRHGSTGAKGK